jgi:tryptophan synthase alpha chain
VGLKQTLQFVADFRRDDASTPVVLMGYANPIEHLGREEFARRAAQAGVDGVLVVDYPPEECEDFAVAMKAAGIDPIFLLAPTSTDERIARVAKVASGYLYYVSLKGITGAGHLDVDAVAARIPKIKALAKVPVGVGFGIRDAASAQAVARVADAVVVGSRIIQEMESVPREAAVQAAGSLLAGLRRAIDEVTPAAEAA